MSSIDSSSVYDLVEPTNTWQYELMVIVKNKPDNRKIIWIYEEVGATGKTDMALWLMYGYRQNEEAPGKNEWFITRHLDNSLHTANVVEVAINNGWKRHGFVFDLCRSAKRDPNVYKNIVDIKDGLVTTSNKTLKFRRPHVVVFANWAPEIEAISLDRWMIYKIVKSELNDKLNYNWKRIDISSR